MPKNIEEVVAELGISLDQGDDRQLEILRTWCQQHISRDVIYEGPYAYEAYIKFAKTYYAVFLDHVPGAIANLGDHIDEFDGMNAIQYASLQGYDVYLQHLENVAPAIYSSSNRVGMTPLHLAAVKGRVHTVELLLAHGANPNALNCKNQLPIHSVLTVPIANSPELFAQKIAIFEQLEACTDPDLMLAQDSDGDNIFHLMACANIGSDAFLALLQHCLENPHSAHMLRCKNQLSHYPIHTALLNLQEGMAAAMLAVPAGDHLTKIADLKDKNGQTALHYAVASHASEACVLQCIQAASDINHMDRHHETALMLAVNLKNDCAKNLLIAHNADTHGIRGLDKHA